MTVVLSRTFTFESAHFLPYVPEGHRCRRMHGHSYRIEVAVAGPVDPVTGWLLDYGALTDAVRPCVDSLDHRLLNAIPGLENPTSENLATWIWEHVAAQLPGLTRVTVFETCTTRCDYLGAR